MTNLTSTNPTCPPRPRWQLAMSVLLILHFLAIGAVVTGSGSGRYSPAPPAAQANQMVTPYLQFLFLDNPYRFYSPNPGNPPVLWIRACYSDRSTRLVEWPSLANPSKERNFSRALNTAAFVCHSVPTVSGTPAESLGSRGETILASYARRISKHGLSELEVNRGKRIEEIEFYSALHRVQSPQEARTEPAFELSRCDVKFLGTYASDGRRLDTAGVSRVSIPRFAARSVSADLRPLLAKVTLERSAKALLESGTPLALCRLLERHPELLNDSSEGLADRIAAILQATPAPAHAALAQPTGGGAP